MRAVLDELEKLLLLQASADFEFREIVHSARKLQIAKDPDDNKFLECADAARADSLITGNRRHFPEFWKLIKGITSREFIGIVAPHFTL